jgi:hypothetical protein
MDAKPARLVSDWEGSPAHRTSGKNCTRPWRPAGVSEPGERKGALHRRQSVSSARLDGQPRAGLAHRTEGALLLRSSPERRGCGQQDSPVAPHSRAPPMVDRAGMEVNQLIPAKAGEAEVHSPPDASLREAGGAQLCVSLLLGGFSIDSQLRRHGTRRLGSWAVRALRGRASAFSCSARAPHPASKMREWEKVSGLPI